MGVEALTGGTDNHMILINVGDLREALTGLTAQKCLEECGIIAKRIPLPYDNKTSSVTSGIRLGTPIVTKNGMGAEEMETIAVLIDAILKGVKIVSDTEYRIDESFKEQMRNDVKDLCIRFPIC